MPLTLDDIIWYHAAGDTGAVIDSCGKFPNVPLISRYGGITYNPALAKRQFGYPMKEKPNNLSLSGEFYLNNKDYANMRTKFVQAWHTGTLFVGLMDTSWGRSRISVIHLTLSGSLIEL